MPTPAPARPYTVQPLAMPPVDAALGDVLGSMQTLAKSVEYRPEYNKLWVDMSPQEKKNYVEYQKNLRCYEVVSQHFYNEVATGLFDESVQMSFRMLELQRDPAQSPAGDRTDFLLWSLRVANEHLMRTTRRGAASASDPGLVSFLYGRPDPLRPDALRTLPDAQTVALITEPARDQTTEYMQLAQVEQHGMLYVGWVQQQLRNTHTPVAQYFRAQRQLAELSERAQRGEAVQNELQDKTREVADKQRQAQNSFEAWQRDQLPRERQFIERYFAHWQMTRGGPFAYQQVDSVPLDLAMPYLAVISRSDSNLAHRLTIGLSMLRGLSGGTIPSNFEEAGTRQRVMGEAGTQELGDPAQWQSTETVSRWGVIRTAWVDQQRRVSGNPIHALHQGYINVQTAQANLDAERAKPTPDAAVVGRLETALTEARNAMPALQQAAQTAFANWQRDHLSRELDQFRMLADLSRQTQGRYIRTGTPFDSMVGLAGMFNLAERVNPEFFKTPSGMQAKADFEKMSKWLGASTREDLEDIGFSFSSKFATTKSQIDWRGVGPGAVPYSYRMSLQQWRGAPPRGQFDIDVITAHLEAVAICDRVEKYFKHKLLDEIGPNRGTKSDAVLQKEVRDAYAEAFTAFFQAREDTQTMMGHLVSRSLIHGIDGTALLSSPEEREAFAIIVAQRRLADQPLMERRREQVGRAWQDGFVELPLSEVMHGGLEDARRRSPGDFQVPAVLRGAHTADDLQAAAARLGPAYQRALTAYNDLERRLQPMRPLLRAFEQVTPGTPLIPADVNPLVAIRRQRIGDVVGWEVPDNDPLMQRQYLTVFGMPFQAATGVIGRSTAENFGLNPIELTQRVQRYLEANSGNNAYHDLDLLYRRALRIADRYGRLFDGTTGAPPKM